MILSASTSAAKRLWSRSPESRNASGASLFLRLPFLNVNRHGGTADTY